MVIHTAKKHPCDRVKFEVIQVTDTLFRVVRAGGQGRVVVCACRTAQDAIDTANSAAAGE